MEQQMSWQCCNCLQDQLQYFLIKCPKCHVRKQQFYTTMKQGGKHDDLPRIGVIDFTLPKQNQLEEHVTILLSHLVCDHDNTITQKGEIVIQEENNQFFNKNQQAIDPEQVYIFENREKAEAFKRRYQHVKIRGFISLGNVYPKASCCQNIHLMLKQLKIKQKDDFVLTQIVETLLNKGYNFHQSMVATFQFPIPEEEARIQGLDNLIILDFEATCEEGHKKANQEIIEFPAQVYNVHQRKVVKEFWNYIRPTDYPILSEFCKNLTKITQEKVDNGILLQEAVQGFQKFSEGLGKQCLITCGDFDLCLLKQEAKRKGILLPDNLRYYINLKKVFPQKLRDPNREGNPGMVEMLENCKLELLGQHHSGIDDVRNLTRIVDFLMNSVEFKFDERMIIQL